MTNLAPDEITTSPVSTWFPCQYSVPVIVPEVVSFEAATGDAGPTSAMKTLVSINITRIVELNLSLRAIATGYRERI